MIKIQAKKIFALTSIVFMIFVCALVLSNRQYIKIAWAEDEEEDEDREKEEQEDEDDRVRVIDTSPENNKKQKTEYMTVYRKQSDTVTTKTDTITRHDSDGDGLYDDEDPHPTISEYFIVKDNDLNGIDDRYEPKV